ncbi:hypothetical protein [Desulfolutivibrio sp.]|uniref:hypothetical protein n=1 Tax=Desulfolutivibrio sp. TaxID=2773296 RepID=UPI002F96E34C
MDAQSTVNAAEKTATLRLSGPCGTEHAAALAAAWGALLVQMDGALSQEKSKTAPPSQGFVAVLDLSGVTGVGLAFFEVMTAAAKALARRGIAVSRQGALPDSLRQAAHLAGFTTAPGLGCLFAPPPDGQTAQARP